MTKSPTHETSSYELESVEPLNESAASIAGASDRRSAGGAWRSRASDPESRGTSSQPRSTFCTRKIAIGCVGFAALVSALIAAGAVISTRLQANNSIVSASSATSATYADGSPMATPTLNSITPTVTRGSEWRRSMSPPTVSLPTRSRAGDRSSDGLGKELAELAAAGNVAEENV